MKTYKLQDPEKKGLLRISLVDDPAIQSSLMAFASEDESPMQFLDEEQMIIYAPALIPNKLIFRKNINGEPAQVFFDAETIKELHINGSRNNYDSNINLNHENDNTSGIFCFESWIIEDEVKDKAFKLGFDLPVGTLMKGYKIDNKEVWDDVKGGKLTGLSIEAYLSPDKDEQVTLKKQNMNKPNLMQYAFAHIKALFAADPTTELAAGFFGSSLELGAIITDKEGNVLPNAEFDFEGNKYKTDEMGAISEIEPIEESAEEGGEDELAKAQARIVELETEVADLKAEIAKSQETQMANEATEVQLKAEQASKIEKLEAELIDAKKVQHVATPPKKYEEMSNAEKVKFNREHR